jgi:hypothetical protein
MGARDIGKVGEAQGKVRDMRVLGRTVYVVAVTAVLGALLAACSPDHAGTSAGDAASVSPAPRSSAGQVAAVSRNVSFTAAGTTTYGTLDIPAHRSGQRLAATSESD